MAFVALSIVGELWWWVTILVLVREWGITLLRLWVIRHGVMAAGRGGKLKTVLQTVALGFFILPVKILQDDLGTVGSLLWGLAVLLMTLAVAVTLVTGVDYVVKALAVRRKGRAGVEAG
jgi:CDP-diacylglycerol--glycerol-3-phosphate 3-phosphatidyltransferase